jgi:hypothetical protein
MCINDYQKVCVMLDVLKARYDRFFERISSAGVGDQADSLELKLEKFSDVE